MAVDSSEKPEDWNEIGKQLGLGVVEALARANLGDTTSAIVADTLGKVLAVCFKVVTPIGIGLAKGIAQAEDEIGPELQRIAAAAASDVFGREVPASAFGKGAGGRGNRSVAEALGAGLLDTIAGGSGPIEPGDAGAKRYLGLVVNMALEGWYQGWFFEFVSSLVPYIDIGKIESFGELDDTLAQALGLGRLSRRVIGPIVDATCVKPLEWETNKRYRPELLSPALAVREYLRGQLSREQLDEELARQGWSTKRIDAHLRNASHDLSLTDAMDLIRSGRYTRDEAIQSLREQGYDEDTARLALIAAETRRLDRFRDDPLAALKRAFINGDITESQFRTYLPAILVDDLEREMYESNARIERSLGVKRLSHGEMIDLVLEKILTRVDYRRWLEREGYSLEDSAALELRLAKRLQEDADIETERARIARERAEEKRAKDEAADARRRELEEKRALSRRGSTADLERAVIRGIVTIDRLAEVLRPQFDSDTVDLMLALVEDDRARYVAQQQAAEDARARGNVRKVDVGTIEQAVLANILTFEEFSARLAQLGFTDTDRALLVAVLRDRKADLDAAARKRAEAEARAKVRGIDLARYEILVRRGLRTLAQYEQLVIDLGYDAGAAAALVDLLELRIADDAAAARERAEAEAEARTHGVSIEALRRAVIRGLRSEAEYANLLISEGFTAEAQSLLLDDLRLDVAEAEAARQRREEAAARAGARALSVDTLARAARLGVIGIDTYRARLVADGYTEDEIAIDLELLALEIADEEERKRRRAELEAQPIARGLTLAELARGVKTSAASIEDYRARAAELGYSAPDIELLVDVLQDELATLADARARREELGQEAGDRPLALGQLEEAVKAGLKTVDEFIGGARALGYGADDAELLAVLMEARIAAKDTGG